MILQDRCVAMEHSDITGRFVERLENVCNIWRFLNFRKSLDNLAFLVWYGGFGDVHHPLTYTSTSSFSLLLSNPLPKRNMV